MAKGLNSVFMKSTSMALAYIVKYCILLSYYQHPCGVEDHGIICDLDSENKVAALFSR